MWIPLLLAGGVVAYVWSKREPTPGGAAGTNGNGGKTPVGGGSPDTYKPTDPSQVSPAISGLYGVPLYDTKRMKCASEGGCAIRTRPNATAHVIMTVRRSGSVRVIEEDPGGWSVVAFPSTLVDENGQPTNTDGGMIDEAVHRVGYMLTSQLVPAGTVLPGEDTGVPAPDPNKPATAVCSAAPCLLYPDPTDDSPPSPTPPIPLGTSVRIRADAPLGVAPIGWVTVEVTVEGVAQLGFMKTSALGLTPDGYAADRSAPTTSGPRSGVKRGVRSRTGQASPIPGMRRVGRRAIVRSSRGAAKAPMRATQSVTHGPVSQIDVGHVVTIFESSKDILGRTITRARYVSPFDRSVHNGWMLEADLVRI